MKKCIRCGKEIQDDALFCKFCGQQVSVAPGTGTPNNTGFPGTGTSYNTGFPGTGTSNNTGLSGSGTVPVSAASSDGSWYIIEFLKSIFRTHKIPVLIYFGINLAFIMLIFCSFSQNKLAACLVALIVYVVSLTIALSSAGEWLMRKRSHCDPIGDQAVLNRIMPDFTAAYGRAKSTALQEGLSVPDDVELYMNDDNDENAFATGRKTICITRGLLNLPDDQIISILCHEFGHIAHHDTDLILAVSIGNFIVMLFFDAIRLFAILLTGVIRVAATIIGLFTGDLTTAVSALFVRGSAALGGFISVAVINFLMFLWTKLGMLLIMKSSRGEEFQADAFSGRCGYGAPLCDFLTSISGLVPQKKGGVFAALAESHPHPVDRIAALKQLGLA